jgi:uncharacterized lipoprotein YmbA
MKRSGAWRLALGGAALALLAACNVIPPVQADLTRFYVLTADAKDAGTPVAKPVRISLRPVDVPDYLHSRVIEVRVAENEVRYVDEARWAEPLEEGITHVLHDDLAHNPALALTPRGDAHDYDVTVQVRQCEGVVAGRAARFAAHIEIHSTDTEPKLVAQADFAVDVPGWDGKDYADLAKKLSEAVSQLGDRIAGLVAGKS